MRILDIMTIALMLLTTLAIFSVKPTLDQSAFIYPGIILFFFHSVRRVIMYRGEGVFRSMDTVVLFFMYGLTFVYVFFIPPFEQPASTKSVMTMYFGMSKQVWAPMEHTLITIWMFMFFAVIGYFAWTAIKRTPASAPSDKSSQDGPPAGGIAN